MFIVFSFFTCDNILRRRAFQYPLQYTYIAVFEKWIEPSVEWVVVFARDGVRRDLALLRSMWLSFRRLFWFATLSKRA